MASHKDSRLSPSRYSYRSYGVKWGISHLSAACKRWFVTWWCHDAAMMIVMAHPQSLFVRLRFMCLYLRIPVYPRFLESTSRYCNLNSISRRFSMHHDAFVFHHFCDVNMAAPFANVPSSISWEWRGERRLWIFFYLRHCRHRCENIRLASFSYKRLG